MGKVILCCGVRAEKPFKIKSSGVNIYSVEELCYYIGHNIDTLCEDDFGDELAKFFSDGFKLPERGVFIDRLLNMRSTFKDIIVAVLCSCDYYDEAEIHRMLREFDIYSALPPAGRQKLRADKHMREGRFGEALREYRSIISDKKNTELTSEEYGNILHNIAVLQVKTGAFDMAAGSFREAYERNHNRETLKQYLYALKLGQQDEKYRLERSRCSDDAQLLEELDKELASVEWEQPQVRSFEELETLKQLREQGRMHEYDRLADSIIAGLKKKYREDNFT